MKTIAYLVFSLSLTASVLSDDTWDKFRLSKPTQTYDNLDGSRTYRYDSPGKTQFEKRSPESVANEGQFDQMIAAAVIWGLFEGGKAVYEWWNTPKMSNTPLQRPSSSPARPQIISNSAASKPSWNSSSTEALAAEVKSLVSPALSSSQQSTSSSPLGRLNSPEALLAEIESIVGSAPPPSKDTFKTQLDKDFQQMFPDRAAATEGEKYQTTSPSADRPPRTVLEEHSKSIYTPVVIGPDGHTFNANGYCTRCGWATDYVTRTKKPCIE